MRDSVSEVNEHAALEELPALLTVDEIASVLRIGRSLVYSLARQYEASDGKCGVPVIRVGCSFRSPRWAIVELITTGQVAQLQDSASGLAAQGVSP